MDCIGCGSAAVAERSERTPQGYRRFHCRACGNQYNERSDGSLNRTQYPSDVFALVVRNVSTTLIHPGSEFKLC